MMDIFFQDPSEVPLPPDEVRIRDLRAEPWGDGRRVRIYLEVDPFQKRPNASLIIYNIDGDEVAQVSLIETMSRKLELTMHLREANPAGNYSLQAQLYYQSAPDEQGNRPESQIVDRQEAQFRIDPRPD